MNLSRISTLIGGLFGAASIAVGAFQAHGLQPVLEKQGLDPMAIARRLELGETATRYLLVHAVALVAVAALANRSGASRLYCFVLPGFCAGCLLFCGSLLGVSLSGIEWLAGVAPYGGSTLIASWLLLAVAGFRSAANDAQ